MAKPPAQIAAAVMPVVMAVAFFVVPPLAQPQAYHAFADTRSVLGIAHFTNVASGLVFALSGYWGFRFCFRARPPGALAAWVAFFAGIFLVAFGSGFYHLAPDDGRLVWDRLPMSVAFMGLYAAVLADYVDARLERLLLPLLLVGVGSVLAWGVWGDLRPYFAVQVLVLGSVVLVLVLGPSVPPGRGWLLGGMGCYALAVGAELGDRALYEALDGALGGHAVKHLLAGVAPLGALMALRRRRR